MLRKLPGMATGALTDKSIKSALSTAFKSGKSVRLRDGAGLQIDARPNGSGWWRLRYWIAGKEGMLSLGVYPGVSLKRARELRDDARKLVAAGINPSQERKAAAVRSKTEILAIKHAAAGLPTAGSFEHIARQWHSYMLPSWSEGHGKKILALLENDTLPFLGHRPISQIPAPEVLKVARAVEARGAQETAYRVLKVAGSVFRYGVQNGYCESDPTRDLRGAIKMPASGHRAAITDPDELGALLRAIDGYQGTPVVRAALALAPLVFIRPGELRKAEWQEFNLDEATWLIPSARMKGTRKAKLSGRPHVVPLAPQAVKILRGLLPLTGKGTYVFPSPADPARPLSENGVLAALRRMGFGKEEITGHGFRATARTLAVEVLDIDEAVVEAQLAHAVSDALGRAYNRTQFLRKRRALMLLWADYLDRLRLVPLRSQLPTVHEEPVNA